MAIQRRLSDSRVNRAIDDRDDKSGSRKPGVIDYKALGEIPQFRPKVGNSYKLNVIPYVAKNPLNPMISGGQIAVGDLDLWLEVWAHRDIGQDKAYVLCPNKMWGKRCPICDLKQKLYDAGDDDRAQKFAPSKRLLMFVQVFEKGEPLPIQLFEVAHFSFGAPLLGKADRLRKEGKIDNFGDPDRGNLIKFYVEEGNKKGWIDYVDFEFLEREEEILDEDLDNPSIDEHMIVYTAEELQKMLDETEADRDCDDDRRERGDRSSRRGRDRDDSRDDRRERSGGKDRDRDDDRSSRRDRARSDSDGDRRERSSRRDERDDDRSSRRDRGEDSGRGRDEAPSRSRTNEDRDESPAPSTEAPTRQRPVEDRAAPNVQADSRCPHNHGWGPEAVDKFPQCSDCSKWSECLEGR